MRRCAIHARHAARSPLARRSTSFPRRVAFARFALLGSAVRGESMKIASVRDVAEAQLCCGCGACAIVSPRIHIVDDERTGRRPIVEPGGEAAGADALRVCPGAALRAERDRPGAIPELRDAWGPVLAMWEGHARDPEVRFHGSSGGAASALAIHALERGGRHGVLHVAALADAPLVNRTVLSRTRAEILAATGSRYAPASPCDGLAAVEQAPAPCVFIGKPCDVAAVAKLRRERPRLDANLGLTIAFFCAGTPSTGGTLALLARLGVAPESVKSLRYRGLGWPGRARVVFERDGAEESRELSYEESWGFLQAHRQWRCYICPDHTGEFADVAVGDPWYRPIAPGEPGTSLILARTERGREAILQAARDGALELTPAAPRILFASQPDLLRAHATVWGRLKMLRLAGAAVPRYEGFASARLWWKHLSAVQKLRSFTGTLRRTFIRGLRRRQPVTASRRDRTAGPP
jgi:coenzyme F420 hydrogenase subunit beta